MVMTDLWSFGSQVDESMRVMTDLSLEDNKNNIFNIRE